MALLGSDCLPCFSSSASLLAPGQLEEPWLELLKNGEVITALVLSTLYAEKYKGRNMKVGEAAEVKVPSAPGAEPKVWRPKLLHRAGSKEICVFIWVGDESSAVPTIYFAVSPLRKRMQFMKVAFSARFALRELAPVRQEPAVRMLPYVQKKLTNLWQKYDFQRMLEDTLARYPNHLLLCCGISHGAAMAQALALKMSIMYPERGFQAATWNAYKFLDEEGVALMKSAVGKGLLSFVLSRGGYWDSIGGAPRDLAPVPRIVFLDAETGECRPCADVKRTSIGPCSFFRMWRLHFARTALAATRMAMAAALRGEAAEPPPRPRTLRWPTRSALRPWQHGPVGSWSPLADQEDQLAAYERAPFSST